MKKSCKTAQNSNLATSRPHAKDLTFPDFCLAQYRASARARIGSQLWYQCVLDKLLPRGVCCAVSHRDIPGHEPANVARSEGAGVHLVRVSGRGVQAAAPAPACPAGWNPAGNGHRLRS